MGDGRWKMANPKAFSIRLLFLFSYFPHCINLPLSCLLRDSRPSAIFHLPFSMRPRILSEPENVLPKVNHITIDICAVFIPAHETKKPSKSPIKTGQSASIHASFLVSLPIPKKKETKAPPAV
jgi:hypothetical protein